VAKRLCSTVMPIRVSDAVPLNRKCLRIVRTHEDSQNINSVNRRVFVYFFESSFLNYSIFKNFSGTKSSPSNEINRHFASRSIRINFETNVPSGSKKTLFLCFRNILLQYNCVLIVSHRSINHRSSSQIAYYQHVFPSHMFSFRFVEGINFSPSSSDVWHVYLKKSRMH